ncbi:MAG TPA: tetratricopeptide repeat protein [Thermoanaerobaculia bacterium]
MTDDHYDDEQLLTFVDGGRTDSIVTAHVTQCARCSVIVEQYVELVDLFRDPATYPLGDDFMPDAARVHDVCGRAAAHDRSAAVRALSLLDERPFSEWLEYLDRHPSAVSEALVELVVERARSMLHVRLATAIVLLDFAEAVARRLTDADSIAVQRAAVAKERANAFRLAGEYPRALSALDEADRFLEHLHSPTTFERAIVKAARATVFFVMTRYEEAMQLAMDAEATLSELGERYRVQQLMVLRASILGEQGRLNESERLLLDIAGQLTGSDDASEDLARVYANLAECEARLDRSALAQAFANKAIALYDLLGNQSEAIRVQWTLAYRLWRAGHIDQALDGFLAVEAAFEALGMTADAGDVGLDIIEVYLLKGLWDEAAHLSRRLAELFQRVEAPARYAQAYESLRISVTARERNADDVVQMIEALRDSLRGPDSGTIGEPPPN